MVSVDCDKRSFLRAYALLSKVLSWSLPVYTNTNFESHLAALLFLGTLGLLLLLAAAMMVTFF